MTIEIRIFRPPLASDDPAAPLPLPAETAGKHTRKDDAEYRTEDGSEHSGSRPIHLTRVTCNRRPRKRDDSRRRECRNECKQE